MNRKILVFDDKYRELIETGAKKSTIRLHTDFKVNDELRLNFITPSDNSPVPADPSSLNCTVKITRIDRIRFDEIDESIALTEGYLSPLHLKYDLLNIYENLRESSLLYRILFIRKSVGE